ncbi:hypothetical protein I547_4617 [Mycobacterium kansasii 824]|nr:hypothetical protein I547_4617 [Mycobacterium kansasii 824]
MTDGAELKKSARKRDGDVCAVEIVCLAPPPAFGKAAPQFRSP